eukprot:evm.model.NODE_16386_length_9479_cov_30.199177.2
MPLSVVIPPTQESQPQSRQARKAGSRAILVATMTGMLGILGATFVVVHHRRPMYTDMPSRFLSSRVAAQRSTSAEPFVSLESDRHAPIAAAAAVKSLRASTAAEDTTSFTSSKSTAPYTKAALADEIIDLPGLSQKSLNFRQFSGYLNLKGTEKNIFYWYVEAEEKPDEAPLVFWTNGGPGCSGLFGFMNENGPFRPTVDGRAVHLNPYSWNKIANMLFVEQPVTVGFSYTDNPKDLVFGDKQAAEDNFQDTYTYLVDDKKNLKLRILIFSGADDSVCATQGTLFWVGNMGWPIKQSQEWTSWGIDGQVAGFLQGYQNGITIATVSGAGHEVPAYKPVEALALFKAYLNDNIWPAGNEQK